MSVQRVKRVNAEQFEQVVLETGHSFIVVDFSADWCRPCKKLEPKFRALADEYSSFTFLNIDADESSDLMDKYDVESVPTFMIFKRGEFTPMKTLTGGQFKKLEDILKKLPITSSL